MRISDTHVQGECYTHGKWAVLQQFVHQNCPVPDECPSCRADRKSDEVDERSDRELEDIFDDGHHAGHSEGFKAGVQSCRGEASSIVQPEES